MKTINDGGRGSIVKSIKKMSKKTGADDSKETQLFHLLIYYTEYILYGLIMQYFFYI